GGSRDALGIGVSYPSMVEGSSILGSDLPFRTDRQPSVATLVPSLATIDDPDNRQHHWHFDENPDHGGKGSAGGEAEEGDSGGHRELEEVACADEGGRPGHAVRFTHPSIE